MIQCEQSWDTSQHFRSSEWTGLFPAFLQQWTISGDSEGNKPKCMWEELKSLHACWQVYMEELERSDSARVQGVPQYADEHGYESQGQYQTIIFHTYLNKMPLFPMVFSQKRFLQIFWVLSRDTESLGRQLTCGNKMRSIMKYIDRCRKHFSAGQKICVDKSTV